MDRTEGDAVAGDQAAIVDLTRHMSDAWKAGDADAYGRILPTIAITSLSTERI